MEAQEFDKLSQFQTASFALWDPEDITNIEYIKSLISQLNSRFIILGLNPSGKMGFLKNFHYGRYDIWYQEVFSQSPFKGCYMSDFISYSGVKASQVMKKWKKDEKFRNKNIKNLRKQFGILKIKKSATFICIGKSTWDLFQKSFPLYIKVFYLKHPNTPGTTRANFINEVHKITKKL